jgi:hypothetical protein
LQNNEKQIKEESIFGTLPSITEPGNSLELLNLFMLVASTFLFAGVAVSCCLVRKLGEGMMFRVRHAYFLMLFKLASCVNLVA